MQRVVPAGEFHIERKGGSFFLYPNSLLGDKGVYFVAEKKKDGSFLVS